MMDINILMYLVPSLIMFGCGIYGFITRKNMIAILISLELMLNSVDINFAVFNRYLFPDQMDGMFFALFQRLPTVLTHASPKREAQIPCQAYG